MLACALAVSTIAASGCGGDDGPRGVSVGVSERDFHIAAPHALAAGEVRFTVHNRGPDAHELLVVRARGTTLPLRRDGMTVDEDALQHTTVGLLEPDVSGSARQLSVRLAPGRYVLLCNMSGHYLGGMHRDLLVR